MATSSLPSILVVLTALLTQVHMRKFIPLISCFYCTL